MAISQHSMEPGSHFPSTQFLVGGLGRRPLTARASDHNIYIPQAPQVKGWQALRPCYCVVCAP